jgi:protease-4
MTTTLSSKKSIPWATAILVAVLIGLPALACLCSVGVGLSMLRGDGTPSLATGDAVAVIFAEGAIASGSAGSTSASAAVTPQRIKADLRRAESDASVKAVVIRVNSPGGSVVASNEIYKAIKDFKKPVVFSFGETAASGGYYIACAGKWIVANPDTLTGSIGVITELPNTDELLKKIGVQIVVIKSGTNKDLGSPFRPMTDDEKKIFQTVIDEAYSGFVKIVAEGRNLPEDQVRQIGDGRVYTGRQAKELGLVDQLGYLEDAIDKAGELGGIKGKPRVVEYVPRPTLFELLTSASSRAPGISLEQILGLDAMPRLQYRFVGP